MTKQKINGILLSAGLGTRLQPYTNTTPKPAIPFLGIPLAVYPLTLFQDFQIHNLVVNIHHLPEEIKKLFHKLNWPCQKLIFSDETEKILGSAGGIRHAIKNLVGLDHFFVANADEVILPNHFQVIKDALDFHRFHKGIATLLTIKHPGVGTQFGGVWVKEGTQVEKIGKTILPNHVGHHYIGIMILSDRIQNYFFTDDTKEENIFHDTLANAMQAGEVAHVHEIEAKWFETGNPKDFIEATKYCENAVNSNSEEQWVEYLRQLIRLNEKQEPIIK